MPGAYSIKLLLILSLLVLGTGCERRSAPPYDSRKDDLILQISQEIADGKDQEALGHLAELDELAPGDAFAQEASLTVRRRLHAARLEELLRAGDYDALRNFMDSLEQSGEAGSELLSLTGLADALQALALFRARMPWETSESLSNAMRELENQCEILFRYPSWQRFWNSQLDALSNLKEQEALRRARQWRDQMDAALARDDLPAYQTLRKTFHADQPDHTFFAYCAILENSMTIPAIPPEMQPFFTVALAAAWDSLSADTRQNGMAALADTDAPSACRMLLQARAENTPEAYEAYFQAMRRAGVPPSAVRIREYLSFLGLDGVRVTAGSWAVPCPGPSDVVSAIRQLLIDSPSSTKGN